MPRDSSPYDRRPRVSEGNHDFIRDQYPPIDFEVWHARIRAALKKCALLGQISDAVKVSQDHEEGSNGAHRFYLDLDLDSAGADVTGLKNALSRVIPGCSVRCGMIEMMEPTRWAAVNRQRTWVEITAAMYTPISRRQKFTDVGLLFFCILGLAVFIALLASHWRGYREPWKRLPLIGWIMGMS